MGVLYYDNEGFPMDDRLMAHVQMIVTMKLRRSENFFLSWSIDAAAGGGRESIWIDNGVPIRFKYSGSRPAQINREWAEKLALAANTSIGLVINEATIEPDSIPAT